MHSSRMRTIRNSSHLREGVPGPWGVYLVLGSVTALGVCTWSQGVYPVPGGTWSQGVYLVPGDVTGPGGCTWSQGVYLVPGVPGPRGCTWSRGMYLVLGGTWSQGVYLVPGGVKTWSRGEGVPAQVFPLVDRHTRVKT